MTENFLPAWSEAFAGDGPGLGPHLDIVGPISRDWAYGDHSGRNVRVAIIDSGIDVGHPQVGPVAESIIVERDDDAHDGVRFVDGPHDDLYGHGTACAAIIRQLAPDVELISVRVLGSELTGSAFNFAHGLQWCIDNGVDIANLSLSTRNEAFAETFHELLDAAAYRRMLVVSAMNNERKRTIPSEFSGVFSVACGPTSDREQIWANPAGPADWAAAGIDVDVAWSGGTTMSATGNSFAAPVITGHLARICSAHPGLTPWQARTVLAALAVNAPGSA